MGKVKVAAFSVSLDGFGAGPSQDLKNPLGVRGPELHSWFFKTEVFAGFSGKSGGSRGLDNDAAQRGFQDVGAWVMGRNMFGPIRGPWKDESWRGWWGENPPFHVPVFVLTHYARPSLSMEGGNTFHFVTEGPDVALKRAKEAAGSKGVRVGGGVSTLRHYLTAGQLDEIHLAFSPVFLGEGEHVFEGINLQRLGFVPAETISGENATHVFLRKASSTPAGPS